MLYSKQTNSNVDQILHWLYRFSAVADGLRLEPVTAAAVVGGRGLKTAKI